MDLTETSNRFYMAQILLFSFSLAVNMTLK